MRWLFRLLFVATLPLGLSGQTAQEIAQRHADRAGEKLARLSSYRAEGRTFIGNQEVPFVLWAQRPDRLRIESSTPSRRTVQVYDGVHPPWLSHSEVESGAPQVMTGAVAREFAANADFDDALVSYEAKGNSVDYAGEDEVEGRAAHKLLVMSKSDDICFLWVDTQNHEIVRRMTYRIVKEQRAVIDTYFKDFRPVAGVMFPHKIEARTNGRAVYTTLIDKMEPNPKKMPMRLFDRPGGWPEEQVALEAPKDPPVTAAENPPLESPPVLLGDDTKKLEPVAEAPMAEAEKLVEQEPEEPKPDTEKIEIPPVKFDVIPPVLTKPEFDSPPRDSTRAPQKLR